MHRSYYKNIKSDTDTMQRTLLFVLALSCTLSCYAQKTYPWEHDLSELHQTEDFQNVAFEDDYDELEEIAEHPFNINTASREQLERLPFLTSRQIEDIQAYVYQYKGMKSLGELAMIESLDYEQLQLLPYFVYAGPDTPGKFPSLQEITKFGKQEVIAALKIPFYRRKGDRKDYLGYPYKHWIKYQFHYSRFIKLGFAASQDAGEPFFAGKNKWGYDYCSLYFQIQRLGPIKNLTLGRYRLDFGMGLILNNNFGLGKLAALYHLGQSNGRIRPHSSLSEANYLQGAATTVALTRQLDLSAFISCRKIDATLNNNSNTIATILKTGYHRTSKEMEKKHNTTETVSGGHLNWFHDGFHAGITAFSCHFNKRLEPKTSTIYRHYYPAGKSFYNLSADYGYLSRRLTLQGETATGDCHAVATLNSASVLLTDELSLMVLQRFYSYKYYSLFSNSFSEGGHVQNESGLYIGANWSPSRHLTLMSYTDYAYFAWPSYRMPAGAHAWDQFFSISWTSSNWHILTQYRLKIKSKDNQGNTASDQYIQQKGRIAIRYARGSLFFNTQLDLSDYHFGKRSRGYMSSYNLGYTYKSTTIEGNFDYFHTHDYDSRLYVYEPGLLYQLSFPSFYGHGIRYVLMAKTTLFKNVLIIQKIGTTDYFDRNHISSNDQLINKSAMTDMEIQIRWKF